jgi:hypothetical protein
VGASRVWPRLKRAAAMHSCHACACSPCFAAPAALRAGALCVHSQGALPCPHAPSPSPSPSPSCSSADCPARPRLQGRLPLCARWAARLQRRHRAAPACSRR